MTLTNSRQESGAAPIAVFAFNRLDLLQQTLGALERCEGFAESPLHFFCDGPRDSRPQDADDVARLRSWLDRWAERHPAVIHSSQSNIGLRQSITSGVTQMVKQYDRVIVLEDDIVVSQQFLRFMNDSLDELKDRTDIFQVSGYFVPTRRSLPPLGLLNVTACWGWATWRRAWQHYRDDAVALLAEVKERDVHAFDIRGSYAYLDALERNAQGNLDTWAVRWYASVFLHAGLTLYPGRSLTRNVGFVEGGTNCGPGATSSAFLRQPIARGPVSINAGAVGSEESPQFSSALEEFYRWQSYQWAKPTWRERVRAHWDIITSTRFND